ncbi:DUF202 domain-containing protein [Gordonia sp. X0973]|uniref:YidH family protein n=1 Tax=Gordonia sp. X0973 TaxID=2742602 RepID=UPI000F53C830|nr:DUF202 domain-containing protein [Gordonia sp. X0973]QKT08009.1 DUF202 domain-containing protein [Gordonia sp. X0973]
MTSGRIVGEIDKATALAVERTRLALERTTMAWIRTSTSLIAFGFTIFKFFQYRRETNADTIASPWLVGLVMIVVGIVTLVLATIQHRQQSRALREFDPDQPRSLAGLVASLIMLLGLVALVVVACKL